ncbi:MAG: LacI family DNA-binding transcriptional regulator [Acidimicrobiia bacterium]
MTRSRTTIEDVAREAGVSVATVSRALRDMSNVSAGTKERVVRVADRLGYHPHTAASWLASGRTLTVGVVAPYYDIWYTSRVLAGIESAMSASGYDLTVYAADTPENRDRFFDRVASLQTRVDGLITVDLFPDAKQIRLLEESRITVVAIGETVAPFSSLAIDNAGAGEMATRHLLDLGHEGIALFGTRDIRIDNSPVLKPRRKGCIDALAAAGYVSDAHVDVDCDLSVHGGATGLDRYLELPDPPTAIFCLSDETAMGAMGRARDHGIEIPGDVSIVGFDDHDLAEPFGLTTIRQPVRAIGEKAAELLLDAIAQPERVIDHGLIPVELVERASTAPPRRKVGNPR